ncbi:RloB family protein [Streptomyces sp. CC224B]|uniref:RloB family protein n=1 Tax=Streptomyces sp. CC224B TaxID=3044571 RepID=UPI0024A902A6|nr:RloB family protein [Streptomyces sp. CC224B]
MPVRERILYVGCEGESTEPDYLRYLNGRFGNGERGNPPFRIVPVFEKDGLTPERVVDKVNVKADGDEAWALFDRDRHTKIPQAVADAAATGVELCFSHPSFDLWLLLHFQEFGGKQSGSSENVKTKLRKAHLAFKKFDERNDKSVKGPRATALAGKAVHAITNARRLVSQCEHGACKAAQAKIVETREPGGTVVRSGPKPPERWAARSGHAPTCPVLDRDPSTDVWRLLASLGITKDDEP